METEAREKITDQVRPVSVWILRHFQPDPQYREEPALTESASMEARRASRQILGGIRDGETLVVYGADVKGRHQETIRLLEAELARQIQEEGRNIRLIIPPSSAHKRPSLRGPGFTSEYVKQAGGPSRLLRYWLSDQNLSEGTIQKPAELSSRLCRLSAALVALSRKDGLGPRCHWLVVTSEELPGALMAERFGAQWANLAPGRSIRLDFDHRSFYPLMVAKATD